jgi:UPF0755 protein
VFGFSKGFQSKIKSFFLSSCACLFFYGFFVNNVLERNFQIIEPLLFEVLPGEGAVSIARRLSQNGLIDNPYPLIIRARLLGMRVMIKTGVYEILRSDSQADLLRKILYGDTKIFSITFKEGWNFSDIVEELNKAVHLKRRESLKEIRIGILDDFLNRNKINTINYEGLFFPDTYFYESGGEPADILKVAAQKMLNILDIYWGNRRQGLPYKNQYEALTLASIVEKEAVLVPESFVISGVFLRRLALGMRLQSDPTVIYGLGQNFKGKLSYSSLRKDTPYNSYTRKGLPVTPISSPGAVSIKAALDPAETEYLYFMAKGDGSHQFSKTLEEHNIAVGMYREKKNEP